MDRNIRVRIFTSLVSLVAGLQGLFRYPENTILNLRALRGTEHPSSSLRHAITSPRQW